ncbi:MAG: murein biosynthesis integral membrane protein MurJ [Anaerolineae bacterium]|nr:murein biosynthesis integral membrane protein MurJ [Anaerolineae bacterium]
MEEPLGIVAREDVKVTQAAGILSLGNFTSRVLGLVREMVKAPLFGSGGDVSALDAALRIPTMIYDLLVGGVLSSAFVPIFHDYAAPERREELWRLLSVLVSITLLILSAVVLVGELLAPQLIELQAGDLSPVYRDMAVDLLRLALPAVIFTSLASVLSGALYALKRFTFPAFIGAAANAAIILTALLLERHLGLSSMAIGTLVGAVLQVAIQLPGMRGARLSIMRGLRHPALRHVGRLYLPVLTSLVVDKAAEMLSYRLASGISDPAIARMGYAAQIIQFPLGLVSAAVSVAILPTLSQQAGSEDIGPFRATLAKGLRLVLVLVIPATIGLYVLAHPAIALIFERGKFAPADTLATSEALRYSLLGLLAAAVDQPLIFAFYARKDTLAPALVGVGTTILYVMVAAGAAGLGLLTLPLLVLINALKLAAHALTMLVLARLRLGGLGGHGLWTLAVKATLASLVMALAAWGAMHALAQVALDGWLGNLLIVGGAGSVGLAIYGFSVWLFKFEEIDLLRATVRDALRRLTGRG